MTEVMETQQSSLPLSVRAVDKAAGLLAGRGFDRRRFLYRFAVIGSALALDPLRFLTRPTPAYASVCGSGNSCDAGWSVFCCTINDGANTCPSGSYVAGWWKVDASAFCLGSPRYYIDCNRKPGSSCRCRCNTSGCDHRRVCCNVFRYGQCNTHIGGVTEVVCRLITCTPPWKWDPSCGRTVRTDPETRSHTSKCLPGKNPSRIEIKYQDLGLVGSVLGRPVTREKDATRNGRKRRYEDGIILWHKSVGAHEVHGKVAEFYRGFGGESGALGYPRTDQFRTGDNTGSAARFEKGSVYKRDGRAAKAVLGRSDTRYRELRGPSGKLGYPTSNTTAIEDGYVTKFADGAIYQSARTDAVEVRGAVLDVLESRGGPTGSRLGFPLKPVRVYDDGGRVQDFEHGLIAGPGRRRVFAVRQQIETRYRRSGGTSGAWGYPTSHTERVAGARHGMESGFQGGTAYWSEATGTRFLHGPILARYLEEGGPAGGLGYPTSDVETTTTGLQRASFERGVITYEPTTGQTEVLPPEAP